MRRQRVIPYATPASGEPAERAGLAALTLGTASACLLLAAIVLIGNRWMRDWQPLLLIVVFVVAMLGLIAVPAPQPSGRRGAYTLAALFVNASCLALSLGLVLLIGWTRNVP